MNSSTIVFLNASETVYLLKQQYFHASTVSPYSYFYRSKYKHTAEAVDILSDN